MYQFNTSSTSHLRSNFRDDILSLIGNAGKTLYTPVPVVPSFSFGFFFGSSLRNISKKLKSTPYFKPLAYLTLTLATLTLAPAETSFALSGETKTFIATAYYSPLPGQDNYYRWSYEADIKLNGGGTHGARWTPVFTGMIAAPKNYDFGTQIFFDGLGLGIVEDRGGAIVEAWARWQAYDRIDIWMGYGDAGLKRTLAWGRRVITGTIVADGKDLPMIDVLGVENGRVDLWQFGSVNTASIGGLSSTVISQFADLGYTVKNGDTKAMILQFQLDRKVIASASDDGAGNYWPKTRSALASAYTEYSTLRKKELDAIAEARRLLISDHDAWQAKYEQAEKKVTAFGQPRLRDSGENVRSLQEFLTQTGANIVVDGRMTLSTLWAIRKYQQSRGLKPTGTIDSTTQSAIIDDMMSR